jgi:hypothetical protein
MAMGEEKLYAGKAILERQGHTVQLYPRVEQDGTVKHWWEIDRSCLATREELEHIADGVYSFEELFELYIKRHNDKVRERGKG